MKKRIVINKVNNNDFEHICHFSQKEDIKYKLEQVPETFEELKELCKSLTDIEDYGESVVIDNYKLTGKGDIQFCHLDNYSDYEYIIIAENRTIPQMWHIIKNLIGEE